MSGEAGDTSGLDPAIDWTPLSRSPWGRRSPGRSDAGFAGDRGGPTYAALDLGTNNCRLLVARPAGEGFRVIDAFSRIIRLGEGVTASGRLSEAAHELHSVLADDALMGAVVLVLANKQDLPNAVPASVVCDKLQLQSLNAKHEWYIQPCSLRRAKPRTL